MIRVANMFCRYLAESLQKVCRKSAISADVFGQLTEKFVINKNKNHSIIIIIIIIHHHCIIIIIVSGKKEPNEKRKMQ